MRLPSAARRARASGASSRSAARKRAVASERSVAALVVLVLGLRKGEVVGLPWSAVNMDEAELDFGWQLPRVGGELLHRETKTEASDATLPLPGICVTALRSRAKGQAEARIEAGSHWIETGLVFTTPGGTPF